ncbi:MAG: hypothetical protein RLZZ546_1995, partial [Bacteroidota bacterium]
MKANEDKHIEELIDKMMKSQITLDSPSLDFTSKVMQHIEIKKQSDAFVYKPLLSKQTILAISSLSLVTLIFYFFQNNTTSSK